MLAFQSHSIFVVKVDIIVSCFATYEFLLYAALIARKTPYFKSWFKGLMVSGLSFYLFTRVVQITLLLALFVLGFGPMSHTSKHSALYWVSVCMCIALMALQMYTFVIYKAIWDHTLQSLPVTNKHVAGSASSSAGYAPSHALFAQVLPRASSVLCMFKKLSLLAGSALRALSPYCYKESPTSVGL